HLHLYGNKIAITGELYWVTSPAYFLFVTRIQHLPETPEMQQQVEFLKILKTIYVAQGKRENLLSPMAQQRLLEKLSHSYEPAQENP
ncbi:hypothetical protein ABTM42_20595, partial [Acinetobacter baumannii]